MKAIQRSLDFLEQYLSKSFAADEVTIHNEASDSLEEARKEMQALQKAGITISRIESYVIEGPARKRGRKSK